MSTRLTVTSPRYRVALTGAPLPTPDGFDRVRCETCEGDGLCHGRCYGPDPERRPHGSACYACGGDGWTEATCTLCGDELGCCTCPEHDPARLPLEPEAREGR